MSVFKLGNWGTLLIAIVSFFIGQFLPQIWKYKEARLGEEKLKLQHLKQTVDLRDKIEDKLTKLIIKWKNYGRKRREAKGRNDHTIWFNQG
jgi:hypothetical protein